MQRVLARDADGAVHEMEVHLPRLHERWLAGYEDGRTTPPS
ncbi:hypothetical protein [Pseudonocardia sp. NPDC049154]